MIKDEVIQAFREEFGFLEEKFAILDLLENNAKIDYETIKNLRLPSREDNIVWYPGVYVFIGNNSIYRIGVSMRNSRARVMQHIKVRTGKGGFSIIDIDKFPDGSILLFNVRDPKDRHWLLALEVYLERRFQPLIGSRRIG
jgi:hypothetical protein